MFGFFDHEIKIDEYPMQARFFYENSKARKAVTSCYLFDGDRLRLLPLPDQQLNKYFKFAAMDGVEYEQEQNQICLSL